MDKIEICNIALSRIGVKTIEHIDEASEQARVCKRFYDFVRENVLKKFHWTFATRRVGLALVDFKQPDYKYTYRYPSDALGLRYMYANDFKGSPMKNEYKILNDTHGRVLCTDVPCAVLEYTANVKDASLMDAEFVEAFSWKLASEIAIPLTGRLDLAQNAVQAYNAYFAQATGDDAAEDNILKKEENRLADARFVES